MKKLLINFLAIWIISLGNSYSQKPYYGTEFKLIPEQISSSEIILPEIYHIVANDNYFIAYSAKRCKFYVFNKKLKLIKAFGTKGKGPKELLWPERVVIRDSIIYVWDYVKKSIFKLTVLGKYLDQIKLHVYVEDPSMFCLNNNNFFFHDMGDYPVVKINMNGEKVGQFGEFYPPFSNRHEKYFNNMDFHLLAYRNKIIGVNAQHAAIYFFGLDGKLVREEKYKDLERFFQKIMDYYSKRNTSSGGLTAYTNISECAVDENRLFIFLTRAPGYAVDDVKVNTILVINLDNLDIIATIRLMGNYYHGLSINNHMCLVYNYYTAKMEMYDIPQSIYSK